MRAVRIGQVAGDEDQLRLELLEQLPDDRHVRRPNGVLADLACLIERQVEEARRAARQADGLDAAYSLRFADDALDVLDFADVDLARRLSFQSRVNGIGE